ncbi:MAG TPA: adenylate kinase [Thermoleophilia bacterium]|nr:adenylate kinase [Thermoleophilia bacterium]
MTHHTDLYVALGPPGSGKGTQATLVSKHLSLVHLSSGEVFREAMAKNTAFGAMARPFVERGELVPDDIACGAMIEKIKQFHQEEGRGTLLDGFPRTVPQAELLDLRLGELFLSLRLVVFLEVSDEEIFSRAAIRGRQDDDPDIVRHRIEVYRRQTMPLLDYYERRGILLRVNGEQSVEDVTRDILSEIGAFTQ